MKTLLLGMGNPILCDDAVGVRLASTIGEALQARDDVDVVAECSVGGLNLLDIIAGYDRLVVFDSIKTPGGVPATWYRFDSTSLRETMNLNNVHDINFATALELGRRMGIKLPTEADIHIFAVEVSDNLTFSTALSPALEEAFSEYAAEIQAEVEGLLGQPAREPYDASLAPPRNALAAEASAKRGSQPTT